MDAQPLETSNTIMRVLDRILETQRPLVVAHLRSLRRKQPHLTPEQMLTRIEKQFLTAVSSGGAAVGATAAIPGLGTVSSLGIAAAETVGFLEATAFFAQAYTEIHGTALVDEKRAKILVMTLLLGQEGSSLVQRFAAQTMGTGPTQNAFWGDLITQQMPPGVMQQVLEYLRNAFVRRITQNAAKGWLGRAIPFGIGAVIGGVGNHVLGRQVIANARAGYGPAPKYFTTELDPRPSDRAEKKRQKQLRRDMKRQIEGSHKERGIVGIVRKNRQLALEKKREAAAGSESAPAGD